MGREELERARIALGKIDRIQEMLYGFFSSAPVGFQIYDADGFCVYVNPAFIEIFQSEPPPEYNVLKDEIAERNGISPLIRRVFAGERVTFPTFWYDPRELTQVKVDQARRASISMVGFPVFDEAAKVEFVVLVVRDETQSMETLERLQASEIHLRESQRVAKLGSWEMDLPSSLEEEPSQPPLLRWSNETFRIFGFEPGVFQPDGETFRSVVHPDDWDEVRELAREAIENRSTYSIEHRVVLADKSERVVHTRAEIVCDPGTGRPLKMLGTVQDITERRRMEHALRASEEQLRQAQKVEALGRLSGGVAHDFNNLLTVINGFAEEIDKSLPVGDPLRACSREILLAADRAAGLTRQLLAFGRKQMLAPRVLNLNEVIQAALPMMRRLVGDNVELSHELASDLGNVRADRGQVEQVLLNLTTNAHDAMPRGGRLTVRTRRVTDLSAIERNLAGTPVGPFVMIAVSDTGLGIDPSVLTHLFEPFFTTKEHGTGLGLATVHGIVTQSGGHVVVDSAVGKGTEFRVYFPSVDQAAERPEPVRPAAHGAVPGKEMILLVEDEEALRNLQSSLLQRRGYRVIEAADADAAFVESEKYGNAIDLLVTDVVMPRIGGRELAENLRSARPDLRVLFLSGYTEDAVVRHAIQEDDVNFLQKPFGADAFLNKVRQVLDASP